MHVGMGLFFQNLDGGATDADVYRDQVGLADRAEPLGFDSVWTAEHHFTGYHMAPDVMQLLTWVAARTSRVRLGSMVVVLPWHEPVRVAEQLSVLDHLSGGRVLLGLGRGLGRVEFDGFRLDMSESRRRFVEYAEAIVGAFDTGILQHDGELYRQPPTPLRPTPMLPLRGRTYASAVSPQSMELMARLGFGVMVIAQKPWETTEREIAAYRDRYEEINGVPPPKPLLVTFVATHESEAGAQEMYERHIVRYARSTVEHYEFANERLADIEGYEYYGKLAENIARHGVDAFAEFLARLQVWGTPEQVADQIVGNVRRLDGAGAVCVFGYGGMPYETARRSQELFAARVLPRLRAAGVSSDVGARHHRARVTG